MNFKLHFLCFLLLISFYSNAYNKNDYWKTKFDIYATDINFYNNMQSMSTTGSVVQFEQVSHGLNALISLYKATEEIQYLDAALTYSENLINSSHLLQANEFDAGINENNPVYSIYYGWYQNNLDIDGTPIPNTTEEVKPIRYMLSLSRLILDNANFNATYKQRAKNIFLFCRQNVWLKWVNYKFCLSAIKAKTIHISCNWAFVANELKYLQKYDEQNPIYTSDFFYYNDYISWYNYNLLVANDLSSKNGTTAYMPLLLKYVEPYSSGSNCFLKDADDDSSGVDVYNCREIPDDVSHANFVVSYVIDCTELPAAYNPFSYTTHIKWFTNTFKDVLWKGCTGNATNPARVAEFIDGSYWQQSIHAACTDGKSFEKNGYDVGEGWVKLGRFSCSLQNAFEDYINCVLNDTIIHQEYPFSALGMYAQMALNTKYLDASTGFEFLDGDLASGIYEGSYIGVSYNDSTRVEPQSGVYIRAKNEIVFKPGFHAKKGSYVSAFIDDNLCNSTYLRTANTSSDSSFVVATNTDSLQQNNLINTNYKFEESEILLTNTKSEIIKKNVQLFSLVIYPNPNKGEFVLELSNAPKGNYSLQVTDAVGRSVIQQNYTVQEQSLKQNINLQAHGKGIYFIKINSEQINELRKIVVE